MNNYNASYPLISLYNAVYIKALSKVLHNYLIIIKIIDILENT